ncbi:MAG: polysaccharide deacetylase family protein [Sphaerochaetaceae bacterium]|nr:polysaccharide deacetylase family protein [Sphaerochaetaceae bacterium]
MKNTVERIMDKRMTFLVIGLLWCIMIAPAAASVAVPEEISAPLTGLQAPPVRYWKSASGGTLPRTVDPNTLSSADVPRRKDPKIVPVMYHNIVFGRTGNVYNRDIYNFEHDMAFLKRNYAIIDFQDLVDIREGRKMLETDGTIITFDDGDLSVYAIVYPLLKELDMKATFFIVPNFIGEVGYMSWDQVREMDQYRNPEGRKLFSFGSHSLTHRALGELPSATILFEMTESKRILESQIDGSVITIALPFGSGAGMQSVIDAAREAGYLTIRTSVPGAISATGIDLMSVKAFNVDNYSNDVFVQHMLRLAGR